MRKKLQAISLFLVLMTSACGVQAPVDTVTLTLTETQAAPATEATIAIVATETPLEQASATPTPETPIPTNPADCTNSAAFVSDVTVEDNSIILSGTSFKKTWRIRNTGTCVGTRIMC